MSTPKFKGFITVTHRNSGLFLTVATHSICIIAPVKGKEKTMATLTLSVPFSNDGSNDLPVSDSYEDILERLKDAQ
jgi:hypothetical protein